MLKFALVREPFAKRYNVSDHQVAISDHPFSKHAPIATLVQHIVQVSRSRGVVFL